MDQKRFGGSLRNVMSPGLKIKPTNCWPQCWKATWLEFDEMWHEGNPCYTPLLSKKNITDSWSVPRGPNNNLPFTYFHLRGKIFLGKETQPELQALDREICINCEANCFQSALFVNALIVLLGLKIQLAITWVQHVTDYPRELRES